MAKPKPKPVPIVKPPSQRDRGYTNILHHLTKSQTMQTKQFNQIGVQLKKIMATVEEIQQGMTDLIQAVKDKAAAVQKHIDDLMAAINSNATPEQLQAIADALATANAEVANIDPAQVVAQAKAKRAKR